MSIFRENQIQSNLKNWLAMNEARILGNVAHRRNSNNHRSGQQHILDFLTSTTYRSCPFNAYPLRSVFDTIWKLCYRL
jgi:hypothetical protein